MDWVIEPYVGVGPLKFGMTSEEVADLLGPYKSRFDRTDDDEDDYQSIDEHRDGLDSPIIHYENNKISEITFTRFTKSVMVWGENYYGILPKEFKRHIASVDDGLLVYADGSFLSMKLGIAFDEYEFDDSDKSITVFKRGSHDEFIKDCVPYQAA
jgi:hypothetical protein